MAQRPELNARLDHVCLTSPDPERLARYVAKFYGLDIRHEHRSWICEAPGCTLIVQEGASNQSPYVSFCLLPDSLRRVYDRCLQAGLRTQASPSPLTPGGQAITDPDGHLIVFAIARATRVEGAKGFRRLQHLAFRTPQIESMLQFYCEIGFVLSDRVEDENGALRACFLRTDEEHHALALFAADVSRFDHLSCETSDVAQLIAWADRTANEGMCVHWGVGRHGPGNDLFFMVQDPDGNLLEISTEIERCAADRAVGTWKHEQRTLNLWGNALLRS